MKRNDIKITKKFSSVLAKAVRNTVLAVGGVATVGAAVSCEKPEVPVKNVVYINWEGKEYEVPYEDGRNNQTVPLADTGAPALINGFFEQVKEYPTSEAYASCSTILPVGFTVVFDDTTSVASLDFGTRKVYVNMDQTGELQTFGNAIITPVSELSDMLNGRSATKSVSAANEAVVTFAKQANTR